MIFFTRTDRGASAEGVPATAILSVDEAAFHGELRLPSWLISGSPDAAREILSSLAGALITVVGVVFSVMIVALTLASQQSTRPSWHPTPRPPISSQTGQPLSPGPDLQV
jgi:hypothetical protein